MMRKWMRATTALLLAALLASALPTALAAGSFKAVVTSKSMKVYAQDGAHKLLGTVPKGETVTVKSYSGKAALISYNGNTGIAKISDMMAVAGEGKSTETVQEKTETSASADAESGKTVVTTKAARVYKKANGKSGYVKVKAGTKLTLLSTSGNVAKVKRSGSVGYIYARCLMDADSMQTAEAEPLASAVTSSESVQKYDRQAAVTTQDCKVYARPSTSSASTSVAKGAKLVLLATKGKIAMVEKDGNVGYMDKSLLTTDVSDNTSDSGVRTADNTADSAVDLSGNNEQIVFKFLTKVMGYNTAAACGVMANIKYESGYKPTSGGDGGSSYGIVQWHLGRKTRLIEWCGSNGFDYTTLEGQLYYLDYELKNRYPAVHKRLLAVSNDEQGAYDAGYDFCYNFEAPSNRAGKSVTRGNYARETLWNRYKT